MPEKKDRPGSERPKTGAAKGESTRSNDDVRPENHGGARPKHRPPTKPPRPKSETANPPKDTKRPTTNTSTPNDGGAKPKRRLSARPTDRKSANTVKDTPDTKKGSNSSMDRSGHPTGSGRTGSFGGARPKQRPPSTSKKPKVITDSLSNKDINSAGRQNKSGRPGKENRDGARRDKRYQDKKEDFSFLKDLLDSGPINIVEKVNGRKFHRLLNDRHIHTDVLDIVLELIIRTQDDQVLPADSLNVLAIVADSRLLDAGGGLEGCLNYLRKHLRGELGGLRNLIMNCLSFLRQLLKRLPKRSSKAVDRLLKDLHSLTIAIASQPRTIEEGIELTGKVVELLGFQIEIDKQLAGDDKVVDELTWLPPNDFREMSVIPTLEDLEDDDPYLQENRMNGYESPIHYLDTQFRLMREDLLAPIRGGIKEYKEKSEDSKFTRFSRLQDAFIYREVQFLGVDTQAEDSLAYVIKFDVKALRGVQWENTKRLMYGNIVCLSADGFKTAYFATIVDRDARGLRKGLLSIKVQGVVTIPVAQRMLSYIMIEGTSYFEAYRYVLERLQSIGTDVENGMDVAFQRYVVDCQPDLRPPDYLGNSTAIAIPTGEGAERRIVPRAENGWATAPADVLDLDDSQYSALQHAMQSEMALVQGPPGTGKTFIGLKIMDILLRNKQVWKGADEHAHVMVICFTNHALDQFLEDVLKLQGKKPSLVRIGGRCKTESLAKYNLRELRYQMKLSIPWKYKQRLNDVKGDQRRIKGEIKLKKGCVSLEPLQVRTGLLSPHMNPAQVQSLYNKLQYCSFNLEIVKMKWLAGWDGVDDDSWERRASELQHGVLGPSSYDHGVPHEVQVVEMNQGNRPTRSNNDTEEQKSDNQDSDSDAEALIPVEGEADLIQSERMVDDGYQRSSNLYREYIKRTKEKPWEKQKAKKGKGQAKGTGKMEPKDKKVEKKNQAASPTVAELVDRYCEAMLAKARSIDPDLVARIRDLWTVPPKERFNMYLLWCDSFFQDLDVSLSYDLMTLQELAEELSSVNLERDCHVIGRQDVIGLTTTGAAKYADIVQRVQPQVVIVEEAAEVLEVHIVTALTQNCKHLILIGDHKQLRPNPTVYELARDYSLNISLFERMISNDMEVKTLRLQHRMRPDISQFLVPWIYEELADHDVVKTYPDVHGILENVVFFDHDRPETGSAESRSHSNDYEAEFVVRLCKYFLQQEYKPTQITILTTYTGQMFNIRNRMPRSEFEGVRVTPVDNFQGEENDIIILSFVRSNAQRNIGFLKEPNRVCVAMSRAKMGFYAFGNFTMYASKTETWKGMVGDMEKQGCLKKSFTVFCENHPATNTVITEPDDFKKVPDGGCLLPCGFKLECGHVCSLRCHIRDAEHLVYKCKKRCERTCERGLHKCPKRCWMKCECREDCPEVLDCGHQCQNACSESCTTQCMGPCEKMLSCGHMCLRRCSEACVPCVHPCERKKPCGDTCPGLCGQNCDDVPCRSLCRKILDCGHRCTGTCSAPCPPCRQPCRKKLSCGHDCRNTCSADCTDACTNPCRRIMTCSHPCQSLCSEACDTATCEMTKVKEGPCGHKILAPCNLEGEKLAEQCTMICNKEMKCGHKCTSSCGRCSAGCRQICSVQVTKKAPDCGHDIRCRCDQTPPAGTCIKILTGLLACGHRAEYICRDKGRIVCKEIVSVELDCGHANRVQCCDRDKAVCKWIVPVKLGCDHPAKNVKCTEMDKATCTLKVTVTPDCGHPIDVKCSDRNNVICSKYVPKILPCTHEAKVQCYQDVNSVQCPKILNVDPGCGHQQNIKCSTLNGFKCRRGVVHKFLCGHKQEMPCHEVATATCPSECQLALPCGHICKGSCHQCHRSGKHAQCREKCGKKQLCGHPCEATCGHERACGPCRSRCEAKCWHSHCRQPCRKNCDCDKCEKPCLWRCHHSRCKKKCNEICDREPCDYPCHKKLPCGHQCLGLCGEPCPTTCIRCHPTKFKNHKKTTRYIRVQPCNHTVPVDLMDKAMEERQSSTFRVVEPKLCPAEGCGRVVLFCPRYGRVIKEYAKMMWKGDDGMLWLRCERCSRVDTFNKNDNRPRCRFC